MRWALVCLLGGLPAAAQELAQRPAIALPASLAAACGPCEQRLLDDLSDGRLDEHSILQAALIAGGAEERLVAACVERVNDLVDTWRASGVIDGTSPQRVEKLFELMHCCLLTGGYRHDASDLAECIQHGSFNCVSATLLWQHLAAEFRISVSPQEVPAHLNSVLSLSDARFTVETTCPQWFSLPAQAPSDAGRNLNDAALIASVYYNHGLTLLERRQFAPALAATYQAHRLDPANEAARGNVLACMNNWALDLAARGELEQAIALLEQGRAVAPEHESFDVNLGVLRAR